ncbi:MAG: EAL domain-containing protein [Eubacterium sp.]|nr:EAL domain-containing protein [Eubacterium sp.]
MGDGRRKKIALLLGQADEEYQKDFIEGVIRQSRKRNYDVCVFSMFIKYQNSREREIGDSNIFEAINYSRFDAVILLVDTIQTPNRAKEIEDKIRAEFTGPVVCIDASVDGFQCFYTDGYNSVYSIISHLIEVHGYRDIAFLAGKKTHRHSEKRVEAYRNAMKDHHIEIQEDRIVYGDFWYSSGASYAETLIRDKGNMPEAVACANDCMAIGLAERLTDNGIRIPEDIAVTGYGATNEGATSPSPLTSAYVPAKYYGSYSVKCIDAYLHDEEQPRFATRPSLFIGCSCGCNSGNAEIVIKPTLRSTWTTTTSDEGIFSIHNFMMKDMMVQTSLEGFLNTVYSNIYQLKNIKSYHLCLNTQWAMEEGFSRINMPVKGYTKQMIHAIKYYSGVPSRNAVSIVDRFQQDEMLPELWSSANPECYIFSPIFFEEKSFGYSVVSYDGLKYSYDEIFRMWTDTLSTGLECLRREMLMNLILSRNSENLVCKMPVRSSDKKNKPAIANLSRDEKEELNEVERLLDNNLFEYHFQPIISAKTGEIFSYEALMRTKTEKRISPLTVLKYAEMLGRLQDVEKLTFLNVLHRVEDEGAHFKDRKVFINSIPGCSLDEESFSEISDLLMANKSGVIVELTEQAELSNEDLERIKQHNETFNLEFAVDDYGTGYSNISNLLRYMPNFVKIDRSLLSDIQNSSQKKHFVRNIIEFCHENNILAIAEGVETVEELQEIIELGADLIQGYYTARPQLEVIDEIDENKKKEIVSFYIQGTSQDGYKKYLAGRTNRIVLNNLVKKGIETIVIGDPKAIHKDITIVGTPGAKTGISLELVDGYDGRVTFENVYLSNSLSKPVIRVGENCNVILDLIGDNHLENGGIKVSESASLEIEGDGDLYITTNSSKGYAIGNSLDRRHGKISFYQDGSIYININGYQCVGIGSGLGGELCIGKGRYVITINAEIAVGVGTFIGSAPLDIHTCDFECNMAVLRGACVGSIDGNVELRVWGSSLKCYASGKELVALGSINGDMAYIDIHEAATHVNVRGERCSAIGSMNGKSEFRYNTATFRAIVNGDKAVIFGSPVESIKDSKVVIQKSDVHITLKSAYDKDCMADDENIRIVDGRYRAIINDVESERPETG